MKNKMLNNVFISTIFMLILLNHTNAQQYTLEESIELGIKNSKELNISKSKLLSSEAKITESSSQMLPQLKFNASYSRLSDIPAFQLTVPFYSSPITISEPVLNSYQFKLSLQQPLFTGFRLSSLKSAAEYNNEASNYEYLSDLSDYSLKIYEAFWNFYISQQLEQLITEQLNSIKQNVIDTKNFLDNGLVNKNDLLKLEVQESNVELKLIEAKNNVELARMNFNRVIGINLNTQSNIITNDINVTSNEYDQTQILEEAKHNRNELKSLESKVSAADEGITAANSTWFPSLYLFGEYLYANPNQRIQPQKDQFDDTWAVGVSLNWDLWDWGNTSSKSKQAEQLKIQAESSLDLLNESIEIDVNQSYLNFLKSRDKIKVSQRAVAQAEENYRITQEKYDVQLATSSELVDAQTYLLEAKTNLNRALVEYELAKVKLDKSMGRKIY